MADLSQGSAVSSHLILFAKAPVMGMVKTRLAAAVGVTGARAAYSELLETVVTKLAALHSVTLCYTPDDAEPGLRRYVCPGWSTRPQGAGDLGARLARAFDTAFQAAYSKVVIIGTDCPYLEASDIHAAWDALDRSDLVIGPALDGGYWLIGLGCPQPSLFQEIPWSTASVYDETMRKAANLGLSVACLRVLEDIDTVDSWRRYQQQQLRESTARLETNVDFHTVPDPSQG